MTPDDIYRAYDGLRPSDEAKKRMLRAIQAAQSACPETKKHAGRRTFRRTLILAAALALVLAFATVTYATDLFGLRSAILYHQNGDTGEPYDNTDVLSLQGLADSPEAMANMRWQNFYNSYDPDGMILACIGNGDTGLDARYNAYPCYTQEMADELDAIANEYGLALLNSPTLYGISDALPERIANVLPKSCETYGHVFDGGYAYDSGSFMAEGTFTLSDGRWPYPVSYQLVCNEKGYLSVSYLAIGDADDYTQWEYETACGVPVMLATGPDKALIIVDRPEAFLVVNVLDIRWGDTEADEMTMPREVLETIADAFSFDTVE